MAETITYIVFVAIGVWIFMWNERDSEEFIYGIGWLSAIMFLSLIRWLTYLLGGN
jgi:hypothetical protein